MVAVGQKHYSRTEFTITVHPKNSLCADFTIHSPKMLNCFGYACKLHGDILKSSWGVSNKKNDGKSTDKCILNTI